MYVPPLTCTPPLCVLLCRIQDAGSKPDSEGRTTADSEDRSANACEKRTRASRIRPANAAAVTASQPAATAAAAVRRARSLLRASPIPEGQPLCPPLGEWSIPSLIQLSLFCFCLLDVSWIPICTGSTVVAATGCTAEERTDASKQLLELHASRGDCEYHFMFSLARSPRTSFSVRRIACSLSLMRYRVYPQGNGTQNQALAPSWSNRYDPDEAEARVRNLIADTERMLAGLSSLSGNKSQKPSASEGVSV